MKTKNMEKKGEGDTNLTSRQRGDFQTPVTLACQIWSTLDVEKYDVVIEPTFGRGSFLKTLPETSKAEVFGWEIHQEYYDVVTQNCRRTLDQAFYLFHQDVLTADVRQINLSEESSVLVIGNPPWVTNTEQGTLGGKNTGRKYNLKSLPGLEAMTGKSNFDICEAIILHLVRILSDHSAVQFALLAKFSVVRNLIQFLKQCPNIGEFEFHKLDTVKHFGVAADAGLIKFKIARQNLPETPCPIFEGIGGPQVGEIGWINGRFVYDVDKYQRVSFLENEAASAYVWRQGVKHDVSNVLELSERGPELVNRSNEVADVEEEILYQLYKSSDIYHGRKSRFVVPIYQRDLKETLEDLEQRFPRLYGYLKKHEADFSGRKSRIYRNRSPFSIFGVGEYTHCTYKVAIGALYPEPVFRLLEPQPRPVVPDDTGYMLATNDYQEAVYLLAVLSLDCTRDFLLSVSHASDKRRWTKDVLARVLIPPMRECPAEIVTALKQSWFLDKRFLLQTQQQLQEWLSRYKNQTPLPPKTIQQYALFVKEADGTYTSE